MMATKIRRPVVMSTPQQNRAKSGMPAEQKQSLLDNFDLEVEDKTRGFKAHLLSTLQSFLVRQESELLRIPRDLKSMKLGELGEKWGGSWRQTVERIARLDLEEKDRAREEAAAKEKAEMEAAKGKRKRSADESPERTSKNARRPNVPASAKKPSALSKSTRRAPMKTPRSKASSSTSSKPPSTLPQDHIFNPRLPPTPAYPRQAKRNESFFSANGSPIAFEPPSSAGDISEGEEAHHFPNVASGEESDASDDLPDPEALEAKVLAQSQRTKPSQASKRAKRAPSLMFRQSMTSEELRSARATDAESARLAHIPLSDGRSITFDPLNLSPRRVDAEIEEGDLKEDERDRVKAQVREEVFKALQAKMAAWKV